MTASKRVAVILSGCGVYDGAEIHESVLTLLALERAGAVPLCAAPDVQQLDVVDHLSGQPTSEARRVLLEAARIARGQLRPLAGLGATAVDAAIFPGGYGVAKNLCDFAGRGADMQVEPETARFLRELAAARKPMGLMCMAPVLAAKLFPGCRLTIGNDPETAKACEAMGARHVVCDANELCLDAERRIVTVPAYMLARSVGEVAIGVEKLVAAVLEMA